MASKLEQTMLTEKLSAAKIAKETILEGDTLISLLQRAGFSTDSINAMIHENVLPKNFKIIAKDFYLSLQANAFRAIKLLDPYEEISYFFWRAGDLDRSAPRTVHTGVRRSRRIFRLPVQQRHTYLRVPLGIRNTGRLLGFERRRDRAPARVSPARRISIRR